jgi:hypothetical protein
LAERQRTWKQHDARVRRTVFVEHEHTVDNACREPLIIASVRDAKAPKLAKQLSEQKALSMTL